ncbi:hypothetical protein IMSAGC002_02621 [Lachnospiraceae bacterium]|nr:hypothetical protein IMSAGC002_02621 [Lachnospiraceae bacterium]
MGINVRVQNAPKPDGIIATQVNLEKNLRSCMRCRFFYGNNSQCLAKKCVKEEGKPEITEEDKESLCFECPYRQSEKYCFPCMRKILRR